MLSFGKCNSHHSLLYFILSYGDGSSPNTACISLHICLCNLSASSLVSFIGSPLCSTTKTVFLYSVLSKKAPLVQVIFVKMITILASDDFRLCGWQLTHSQPCPCIWVFFSVLDLNLISVQYIYCCLSVDRVIFYLFMHIAYPICFSRIMTLSQYLADIILPLAISDATSSSVSSSYGGCASVYLNENCSL